MNLTTMMKRPRVNPQRKLAEVELLIYKLAWDMAKKYRLPYDECLSEVYWQFMRAVGYYKPAHGSQSKFSTFFHRIVLWQRTSFIKQRQKLRERMPEVELTERHHPVAPDAYSPSLDVVAELSPDAQELARLLLNAPPALVADCPTPRGLLSRVKAHLGERRRSRWTRPRLQRAERELASALREAWA